MTITYDDFARLNLRTAAVTGSGPSGIELDLGGQTRTTSTDLAVEAGRQVVVIANLEPADATPEAQAAAANIAAAWSRVELRIANVLECKPHPNADKLLVLQIELGEERRQICAGLRAFYQPEQLAGRQIVVVANLDARKMRGEISQGMLLAATDAASDPANPRVIVIGPSQPVASGTRLRAYGCILATLADTAPPVLIAPAEAVAPGSVVK